MDKKNQIQTITKKLKKYAGEVLPGVASAKNRLIQGIKLYKYINIHIVTYKAYKSLK